VLADLAIGRMRTAGKLADLSQALAGRFTDHHALLCRLHLDRITGFSAAVADLDERIAGKAARWQRAADLLKTIPGFGDVVAWAWLGEIGPAPHLYFPDHDKLASWVTLCPWNNFVLIQAEHRDHAVIEQLLVDLASGPLAHMPSGKFTANAAWLALAGIAHNLLRAAGCLDSARMARARGITIRAG
jgi:hypothetical protein